DMCRMVLMLRSPMTISARPESSGATSSAMSDPEYWLSASVLTMMSAPARRLASMPATKAAARPFRRRNRTTWWAPCARATSDVRSVEPSSTIRISIVSIPGIDRGRSASVAGRVSASFRQGIWMTSFMFVDALRRRPRAGSSRPLHQTFDGGRPGNQPGLLVPGLAHPRGARRIGGQIGNRAGDGRRIRIGHTAVDTVLHEGRGFTRVVRRDDGFLRQECLERDVPEILVVGRVDDSIRTRIQVDERLVVDLAEKLDAI